MSETEKFRERLEAVSWIAGDDDLFALARDLLTALEAAEGELAANKALLNGYIEGYERRARSATSAVALAALLREKIAEAHLRLQEAGRHIECSVYEGEEMQTFLHHVSEPLMLDDSSTLALQHDAAKVAEGWKRGVDDALQKVRVLRVTRGGLADADRALSALAATGPSKGSKE